MFTCLCPEGQDEEKNKGRKKGRVGGIMKPGFTFFSCTETAGVFQTLRNQHFGWQILHIACFLTRFMCHTYKHMQRILETFTWNYFKSFQGWLPSDYSHSGAVNTMLKQMLTLDPSYWVHSIRWNSRCVCIKICVCVCSFLEKEFAITAFCRWILI